MFCKWHSRNSYDPKEGGLLYASDGQMMQMSTQMFTLSMWCGRHLDTCHVF